MRYRVQHARKISNPADADEDVVVALLSVCGLLSSVRAWEVRQGHVAARRGRWRLEVEVNVEVLAQGTDGTVIVR